MHHHHRRRKKRPNYGTRTIEIQRGLNGLGFILSGQQPCILSCIVSNSPADLAGLRAGDFLISVNGLNVSKLPHESVVQLIGNSYGTIRMQIAENYFSDSSDEENISNNQINRAKPRYLHHKLKMNRLRNSPQKIRTNCSSSSNFLLNSFIGIENVNNTNTNPSTSGVGLRPVIEDALPLPEISNVQNLINSPNSSTSKVSNIRAMIRPENDNNSIPQILNSNLIFDRGTVNEINSLEYRAIVGYLGTIEMPKQIATSSKLQTVRSCIRKLRQEKRNPTTVLMTILPNCLTLKNSNSILLATYPSSRLNYVSSSSESENRFFGLVTSAIYANTNDDDPINFDGDIAAGGIALTRDVIISNSCHVFVIDTKICDHIIHEQRATEFQITCTKDPISNLCLEFPNNSEYVVNLIRSMYTMKVLPPTTRYFRNNDNGLGAGCHGIVRNVQDPQANSPQPSNHSEITTTSSNSDSGIGFHNDCTNISDRILVVDFPGILINRITAAGAIGCGPIAGPARPLGICNDIDPNACASSNLNNDKILTPLKPVDYRLTVRAMPDPKVNPNNKIPDLLTNFNLMKNLSSPSSNLITTRSCDDVISSVERNDFITIRNKKQIQMSMDDITLLSSCVGAVDDNNPPINDTINNCRSEKEHVFIAPGKPLRKNKKLPCKTTQNCQIETKNDKNLNNLISYKLSPQVFGISPKVNYNSNSFETLSKTNSNKIEKSNAIDNSGGSANKNSFNDFEIWGSLQELNKTDVLEKNNGYFLEGTYSEPDLMSRALPSNTSPFRRWGQSSFRAPRTTEPRPTLGRRPSSLAASENDVYTKSMDEFIDDINSVHSSHSGGVVNNLQGTTNLTLNTKNLTTIKQTADSNSQGCGGVQSWGNSFEKLLEDSAGLHTFAEFLKKEFSAENIYFWTACERYRLLDNDKERSTKAMEIFSKHLDSGCTEPVNVDSQARNIAQDNLNIAERNLFSQAQKQIFNLMKFDSYQRFIRSDLYKKCIDAEAKNQPLPYPGELLDENLRTSNLICVGPSKLKKSASNAEDRRRKSLLPWHRKTRCKSRDRANTGDSESTQSLTKSQSSGNNSLKQLPIIIANNIINNTNSTSDLHSSRSSLSSFDTNSTNNFIGSDEYPLCRVILSDGATTIVPTRPDETIRQLIERLLEKRGIQYQFFDVMYNGQTKAIDLDKPANILASKEVQIEQRVAFKLDLPDPKVISVKSKPKKQLCDVLKPILQKYNYCFNDVQILMRDTHEPLDLSLSVTVADGQRLQVVMLKSSSDANLWEQQQKIRNGSSGGGVGFQQQFSKNNLTGNLIKPLKAGSITTGNSTQQSTLDEITNKVFNELLQGKVESHAIGTQSKKCADLSSLRSDDCTSETSSIFDRLRRRDSNIPGLKNFKPKKSSNPSSYTNNYQQNKLLATQSDDTLSTITQNTSGSDPTSACIKKPLIAKWKTGVKLQVTGRPQNHGGHNQDEFLEGLKRAQRARLEDQRGTEINFELPDFLKDKANLSAANKLRKIRANLSPINQINNNSSQNGSKLLTQSNIGQLPSTTADNNNTDNIITNNRNSLDSSKIFKDRPQPAPRLSISKSSSSVTILSPNTSISGGSNTSNSSIGQESSTTTTTQSSTTTNSDNCNINISNSSSNDLEYLLDGTIIRGPPPLPPKPKILPIKPSNWGQNNSGQITNTTGMQSPPINCSKIPIDITRRNINNNNAGGEINARNIYLDQPSSSFV